MDGSYCRIFHHTYPAIPALLDHYHLNHILRQTPAVETTTKVHDKLYLSVLLSTHPRRPKDWLALWLDWRACPLVTVHVDGLQPKWDLNSTKNHRNPPFSITAFFAPPFPLHPSTILHHWPIISIEVYDSNKFLAYKYLSCPSGFTFSNNQTTLNFWLSFLLSNLSHIYKKSTDKMAAVKATEWVCPSYPTPLTSLKLSHWGYLPS